MYLSDSMVQGMQAIWMSHGFVFNLRSCIGTGSFKAETVMLLQTSVLVGSWDIFSKTAISSDRTYPNTVYLFSHSLWLARLMKNSGPEPTQATDPLLMEGQDSFGISLNVDPSALSVPWISAKGGPKEAYMNN